MTQPSAILYIFGFTLTVGMGICIPIYSQVSLHQRSTDTLLSAYENDKLAVEIFVAVVKALDRRNGEPSGVGAIIVDHMVCVSPHELVALVDREGGKCRVVPPVPPPLLAVAATTTAPPHVLGGRHRGHALASVNLKALVGGNEGRVAPDHYESLRTGTGTKQFEQEVSVKDFSNGEFEATSCLFIFLKHSSISLSMCSRASSSDNPVSFM
nr:hypothetical protein Iba_scaffold11204CG0030 [Ipomoea batatas]